MSYINDAVARDLAPCKACPAGRGDPCRKGSGRTRAPHKGRQPMPAPGPGSCRCGHTGGDPHPCHSLAYTCGKPAKFRLYNSRLVGLSGSILKMEGDSTYACDPCWYGFQCLRGTRSDLVQRVRPVMAGYVRSAVPRNEWVKGDEGRVYIRWNTLERRLDIASIELHERYRGRGILHALVLEARLVPGVLRVRLENIGVPRLAESAKAWKFDGWHAVVDEYPAQAERAGRPLCVTVTWVKEVVG